MYSDSDSLAHRDIAIEDFRKSEKHSKRKIIEKMLELRHNMKYNKHLLSVYKKAKALFDTMVEEHRAQLFYLEEIYRHINTMIRDNLSTTTMTTTTNSRKNMKQNGVLSELMKDKKRIGILLKKMRNSYEKLTNVDTVIGVTIDKMNEITFMDDDINLDGEIDDDDFRLDEYNNDDEDEQDDDDDNDEDEESDDDDNDEDEESEEDDEGEDEEDEDEDEEDEENEEDEDDEGEDEEDEDVDEEDEEDEDVDEEDEEDEDAIGKRTRTHSDTMSDTDSEPETDDSIIMIY
jgi:hypothetical protein